MTTDNTDKMTEQLFSTVAKQVADMAKIIGDLAGHIEKFSEEADEPRPGEIAETTPEVSGPSPRDGSVA